MPLKASDPRRGYVRYHRLQNSLNINFTGINAFEYSFSVKLYEKLDQNEISSTILKFWFVMTLGCGWWTHTIACGREPGDSIHN